MKRLAWTAVAVLLAGLAPGAALAGKPAKEPGPKKDEVPEIAIESPGKGHGAGHGKGSQKGQGDPKPEVEDAPPAEPESSAPPPSPDAKKPEKPPKAPAQETPAPAVKTADRAAAPARAGRGKVALCHATGSATNPFVLIVVSVNATTGNGHGRHAEDLIPAGEGRCGGVEPAPDPDPDPEQPGPGGGGDGEKPNPAPKEDPKPDPASSGGDGDEARLLVSQREVLVAEGGPAVREELPFTGLPLGLLALLGAATAVAGGLVRRNGRSSERTTLPESR